MKIYSADQVADTIISVARRMGISDVTNLKLQKLMYYAQAWSLVLKGSPLFAEDFQAWIHGPVLSSLFQRFKVWRWDTIGDRLNPVIDDPELRAHVGKVLRVYGNATANQLEQLSHSEGPWKNARKGIEPDVSSRVRISKESIKSFYSELLNEKARIARYSRA